MPEGSHLALELGHVLPAGAEKEVVRAAAALDRESELIEKAAGLLESVR